MNLWWVFAVTGIVSWIFTGVLRRYALAKSLMDVPNERSSHTVPTPRGGGLSIVLTFLAGLIFLWMNSLLGNMAFIALSGAGLGIALIGFIDDHGHIAARWRLLSHFMLAGWLIYWLGGLPPLVLFGSVYDFGMAGDLLSVIAFVWLLNLYNFMDGIDGIAGVEALSSTLLSGMMMILVFDNQAIASVNFLMLAAVSGFLVWNLPPAKIFMGDAGSGFLGLMLSALMLLNTHIAPQMFWAWLILLGVFIVDATFTLTRRLLRGDRIYEAHRSHAYQFASRKYGSHLPVTLAVLLINICWLAPWSLAVVLGVVDGMVALLCAYVPLLWLAWYFRAGEAEPVNT